MKSLRHSAKEGEQHDKNGNIADDHNRLANILASGGMKLLNADSAILLGDTLKDLRALAQQISQDIEQEAEAEAQEKEKK